MRLRVSWLVRPAADVYLALPREAERTSIRRVYGRILTHVARRRRIPALLTDAPGAPRRRSPPARPRPQCQPCVALLLPRQDRARPLETPPLMIFSDSVDGIQGLQCFGP
jgi:hypothetical protein